MICTNCGTCANALTFTTNSTQIDGKTVIFITYNNNITITGNLSETMQLVPKTSRRRFLATSMVPLQVDGMTFMFTLPDGVDASNF